MQRKTPDRTCPESAGCPTFRRDRSDGYLPTWSNFCVSPPFRNRPTDDEGAFGPDFERTREEGVVGGYEKRDLITERFIPEEERKVRRVSKPLHRNLGPLYNFFQKVKKAAGASGILTRKRQRPTPGVLRSFNSPERLFRTTDSTGGYHWPHNQQREKL